MPRNKRQARQITARRQRHADKRRAAHKQTARGRKTKPAAQRNRGVSYEFMRAVGQAFMLERILGDKKS